MENIDNSVKGSLNWILRLEGLIVFVTSLYLYNQFESGSWKIFFLLFLLPDIGLIGYFAGSKIGAITYNCTHSYLAPLSLFLISPFLLSLNLDYLCLIWLAHIGFDRALGFGLKYTDGFKYTHLGLVGKLENMKKITRNNDDPKC